MLLQVFYLGNRSAVARCRGLYFCKNLVPEQYTNKREENIEIIKCSSENRYQLQVFVDNHQQQANTTGKPEIGSCLQTKKPLKHPAGAKRQQEGADQIWCKPNNRLQPMRYMNKRADHEFDHPDQ